jgi:hypothetical protein
LCFSFTDLGGWNLREREKLKKKQKIKKQGIGQGYLTLLPTVPSRRTDRQGNISCLSPCQAVMHFKNLILGSIKNIMFPLCVGGILIVIKSSITQSLFP